MNWRQLTKLELKLCLLERDALASYRDGRSGWNAWEVIGKQLGRLVGWWATTDEMKQAKVPPSSGLSPDFRFKNFFFAFVFLVLA